MVYRFGDCEVDTKLLELRRGGSVQPMDPLGFDLLKYLIENCDRVLTRDELLDTLWPGKVVTDSALSSRLKSVRRAVGDSGTTQHIIKTVHGRGYRFVAELEVDEMAALPVDEHWLPTTPAVGRDAELGKLARWLDRALNGQQAIVFISGEAGVGKTTLVRAFLGEAQDRADIFLLHGQCINQRGASEAFLPLLEALGRAGRQNPFVTDVLRRHAPAWLAQLPSLAPEQKEATNGSTIGVTTGRMLRELSEVFDQLAQQRKVVLILEDLHWSDPSTIGWLDYYARRARRTDIAHLLLIATFRPDGESVAVPRELGMRGYAHNLQLESIDEADISDYLTHRLSHPPAPELAALTYRRTGGFPLFIDTLVDHWLGEGLVQKKADTWWPADVEAELLAGVPEDLSQFIDQQLAGLGDEERLLLETAALAGSPFAAASIAYALDRSEEDVEALFGRLARRDRVVRNAGEAGWPDGTVTALFEFRHELYRDALYDRVAVSRRSRLHRALGERLERAYGDETRLVAGEIADHFARARDVGRALQYFYPAALSSFNRSAYRECVLMVNRALGLIETLAGLEEAWRIERDLHLLRASACISLEGWASREVEDSYRRAQELADKLGIRDNAPETYGIAAMHENRGRYTESQAVIESLIERSAGLRLEAHELLACSLFHQGRFDQSKSNADKAIAHYDPREVSAILARYGENPGVSCHNWAAVSLQFMGFPDAALQRSDQALTLAEGHVYSTCSALTLRTFLHQFRNEASETLAWSEKARKVAATHGFSYRIAQILILAGWARGLLSSENAEQQAALESLIEGIRRHDVMGSEMDLPYHLTLQAELLAHMGRIDEALDVQELAIESNPPNREFFYEAEMLRQHAVLLLAKEPAATARAERLLERSLDLARRQDAKMSALRSSLALCEIANGSDGARVEALQELLAAIDEGGDTPDIQVARARVQKLRPVGQGRRGSSRIGPP